MASIKEFFPFTVPFLFKYRGPSALTLLSGAGVAFLFITDWKVILTRVPYIRGRFPPEEDTAPAGEEDTAAAGEEE